MNALQIYEAAKQAQWEADYAAAIDSIESDYVPAEPHRSRFARLSEQLCRMLAECLYDYVSAPVD